jgi:hypothetical protein
MTPTRGAQASPTPTQTPTPTPCPQGCCFVQLCYDANDCTTACQCNDLRDVYIHYCLDAGCRLPGLGIYDDKNCTVPAATGYYSDGTNCFYWDGTDVTLQGPC